ncbi:MAG TPA: type VI secretion system protein IglI family protein [Haliangium sp.]|nr:type VI secretion system protein IglI family protein [Haliangium sp.]
MLDTTLLDKLMTPTPEGAAPPPAAAGDAWLQRITDAADRGDYLDAAHKSAALLEKHVYDIRIIGYYLFGLLIEQGIGHLPGLLQRVHTLLENDLARLSPGHKKERAIDGTMHWLVQTLADRCRYHAAQHDATWSQWMAQLHPSLAGEVAEAIDRLVDDMQRLVDEPRCLGPLGKLRRWVSEDLPRTRPSAPAEHAGPGPAATPSAAATPAQTPAAVPAQTPAAGAPDTAPTIGMHAAMSSAMHVLLRKLRGFEALVERGDMDRAAVVASDIKQIIESFDPLVYLPALFSTYFKLLHRSMNELMPHWQELDSPSGQALQSFYRVDLDGFLSEA